MTEVASAVVHEVLGRRVEDVDQPIVDYIVNVLADEDFDFDPDVEGAFEALGELLVDSDCVSDYSECRLSREPWPDGMKFDNLKEMHVKRIPEDLEKDVESQFFNVKGQTDLYEADERQALHLIQICRKLIHQ